MIQILKRFYWDMASPEGRGTYMAYLLCNIPGALGMYVRALWYGKKFMQVGSDLHILPGTIIIHPERISCGSNVSIGYFNYIQAAGGLVLKDDAMLGPYVKIWTQNHNYKDTVVPIRSQGYSYSPIEIGRDVWIGANAFIMPGATIGDHSIISASSVVSGKAYPEGVILAGYPARKIGNRFETQKPST